jgi:DNA-binding XRE family transcriptional regulator
MTARRWVNTDFLPGLANDFRRLPLTVWAGPPANTIPGRTVTPRIHGSQITNCQFVPVNRFRRHNPGPMTRSHEQSLILKSFGWNVRRLRAQAGLTQAKLAELAGVELRTEQKWERGEINPPLTTLARVQAVFGCAWESLLGEAPSKR